jgi:hyperosmotically inducible periplasmic protein
MNSNTSHKIIVAGGMAVVVGIGVVTLALRSHSVTSVAQIPAAPAATPEIPTAPAVAQIPEAPDAVAHSDSVGAKDADTATPSAVEPKLARRRDMAESGTSAVATNDTVTRTGSAADTGEKPAAETVANSVGHVKSADQLTTTPATTSSPADEQKAETNAGFAASDSQITTDVKSEIAGDSLSKDVNIGVTTTHGVVVLTGSLASQGAIDHVKDVAGNVPGVRSVDTSALVLASL